MTRVGATALAVLTAVGACAGEPAQEPRSTSGRFEGGGPVVVPEEWTVEVLDVSPHDPEAFTQGLEVVDGTLYEGTGLVGESTVRKGPVGGEPTVTVSLPEPLFGEGITVVGSRLWQLTWRSGVAVERDVDTLEERRRVRYDGEGWGLCHQEGPDRLVMSDGTATLTFRDPDDFSVLGTVEVTDSGNPVAELNELECVGDTVYANVWHTDHILRIDPATGAVTARIDASGLLTPQEAAEADVLNGIAAGEEEGTFYITGKLWPHMFLVRFV